MKKLFVILYLILSVSYLFSQDTHFWNHQYGSRSTLLGGAVIGSVSDLSASYYNPGAIALFEDPKLVLSAKAFEFYNISVIDGAGNGQDLDFSTISPSPDFVAYAFDFESMPNTQFAISLLTRQQMNFEFKTRRIEELDVLTDEPGNEDFAGGFLFDQDFKEIWGGLTVSRKFSDIVGIGVTNYIAYRSQATNIQKVIQVLKTNNEIASSSDFKNYEYNNYRLLWKLGIGVNFNPLTFGISFTTPSINITGSGSTGLHYFLDGVDRNGDGVEDVEFESNYQDEISSEYKSSWAVGFGGAYRYKNVKVHLSAEYFDKTSKFRVLDTESFIVQSSGLEKRNEFEQELSSVFNIGLGVDYIARDDLIISASLITDKSGNNSKTVSSIAFTNYDIYHFSGGATFSIGKSEFTLGLAYSFASDELTQALNLTPEQESNIIGTVSETEIKLSRIKLLLGFNF